MDKSLNFPEKTYKKWFSRLDSRKQQIFIYLMKHAFYYSDKVYLKHYERYRFGLNISVLNDENNKDFNRAEISNTYRELCKTNLNLKWGFLNLIIDSIKYRIKNAGEKDDVVKSYELFRLEDEDEFTLLFWIVLMSGNATQIFTYPYDFKIKPENSEIDIPEFREMIEFMGMFLFMIELLNFELYGMIKDTIIQNQDAIARKKRTLKPKIQTFDELFIDPTNPQKVRDILKIKGYIENGIWIGRSDDDSELTCAYHSLKEKHLLRKGYKSDQVKLFYLEFGLPDNLISPQMMRKELWNENRDVFDEIFSDLIPK